MHPQGRERLISPPSCPPLPLRSRSRVRSPCGHMQSSPFGRIGLRRCEIAPLSLSPNPFFLLSKDCDRECIEASISHAFSIMQAYATPARGLLQGSCNGYKDSRENNNWQVEHKKEEHGMRVVLGRCSAPYVGAGAGVRILALLPYMHEYERRGRGARAEDVDRPAGQPHKERGTTMSREFFA